MAWTTWDNPHTKEINNIFLLANFSYVVEHPHDSFMLPSQIQQVFYADTNDIEPWRVVLHSEPRSKRSLISNYEEFINTRVCVPTLKAEALTYPTSNIPNMMGAITLCKKDIEFAITPLLRGDFWQHIRWKLSATMPPLGGGNDTNNTKLKMESLLQFMLYLIYNMYMSHIQQCMLCPTYNKHHRSLIYNVCIGSQLSTL